MHVKIGNHIFFCRTGTQLTAEPLVLASATNVPAAALSGEDLEDALGAFWTRVGCVEMAGINTTEEGEEEVYCPIPGSGKYGLSEVVGGRIKQVLTIDGQDFDELAAQIIYGSATALVSSSATTFTPAKNASIYGWLLVDQYSHNDKWLTRLKLYGKLKIANASEFGDKVLKPKYQFTTLQAAGNAGAFDTAGLVA